MRITRPGIDENITIFGIFFGEPKIDTNKYIHNPSEIGWTENFWSKKP